MKRENIENLSTSELLNIINNKYDKTRANDLVYREMARIYNKLFNSDFVNKVRREAALRVLSGQEYAKELDFIKSRMKNE